MKTLTCKAKNLHHISCPDTTARKEILHAALDMLLITASGIGIGAVITLMLVI